MSALQQLHCFWPTRLITKQEQNMQKQEKKVKIKNTAKKSLKLIK